MDFATLVMGAETAGLKKGEQALDQIVGKGEKAEQATKGVKEGFGKAGKASEAFGRQTSKAGDKVEQAARKTRNFGDQLNFVNGLALKAARSLGAIAAGYVGVQAATAAIASARGFNAALAETSTLIDGTPQQLAALEAGALSLTDAYGGTATDKIKAYYQAISAGAGSVNDAYELLDDASKLAIGGVTDTTTAVDALTTATNAYAQTGLTASDASDAMFVGMRAGKTTIGELSAQLGQIVPIASAAGVSFDEVIAGVSALTTQGQSTAMATTGLRSAIAAVIAPTSQASDLAKELGLAFNVQALEAQGLAGFLQEVSTKTGGSQEAMAQLFGSVEALNAVLAFSGGAGDKFSQVLADMANRAGATDAAFQKINNSLDKRLNKAMGQFSTLGHDAAQMMLGAWVPAVEAMVAGASVLVENFDIVAAGIVGLTATALPALITGLGGVTAALSTVAAAAWAAAGPWGMLAGLIAGAASYFLIFKESTEEAEDASYDASAHIAALNGELDSFHMTAAPSAAQKAIELANDYHKLAKAARDAAQANLALMQSQLSEARLEEQRIKDMISQGHLRELSAKEQARIDAAMTAATNRVNTAKRELLTTEEALETAARKRRQAADQVTGAMSEQMTEAKKLETQITVTTEAVGGLGGASGKTAKELEEAATASEAFDKALKEAGFTAEEWGTQQAQTLIGGIDSVADAWGEFVASGFTDFKGFARSILDTFKSMLVQMIAMAAKNRIMIALGLGGVSAGGIAGQAVGAAVGGGGGLLGGLFGGAAAGGGIMAGLWTGLGGILSGGGLGASFSMLGGLLGGSVSGLGAIGAAIPAIGIVVAGLSLLIGKTRELDHGIRVTVDGYDSLIETFSLTETSRLFGLIKRRRTRYSVADAEIADPISTAVAEIQANVIQAAGILGFGAEAFEDFAASIQISTKDLSEDEALAEIQKQLATIGDGMAEMILGELEVLKAGETAGDALTRLANSLVAVQSVADLLGHSFAEVGIAGAALASDLVDAFGSIEAMGAATGRYFELFYTEEERRAVAARQTSQALADLNLHMPQTRDQYRALIEAQDLTTESGQAAYAALIGLAEAMDFILPAVSSFTTAMESVASTVSNLINDMLGVASAAAREAATAASGWHGASASLRGVLGDLIGQDRSSVGRQRALAHNRSSYQKAVAAAGAGDLAAAKSVPGLARTYLSSVEGSAGSYVEYLAAMAGISADAAGLANVADEEATRHEAIAGLHEQQISLLGEIRDYMQSPDLSADGLSAYRDQLAGLVSGSDELSVMLGKVPAHLGLGGPLVAYNAAPVAAAPSLVATHPGSSSPAPDNSGAILEELKGLRDEHRQLAMQTANNTRAMAKLMKRDQSLKAIQEVQQ